MTYLTEQVAKRHDRKSFVCGEPSLDNYIQKHALNDHKRGSATTFVLLDPGDSSGKRLLGFYSLAAYQVLRSDLPDTIQKKVSKQPEQPATLLARLAVASSEKGKGLGKDLLFDALFRSWNASHHVASLGVFVHALHDRAAAFYRKAGFVTIKSSPQIELFLPHATLADMFA